MEFMRCNKCYRSIQTAKIWRLTQCYHLFCSKCINEDVVPACPACKAINVQSKILTNPQDIKIMVNVFTNIDDLAEMDLEVERFQNEQTSVVMRALATMEKKYELMRYEYWKIVKETNKIVEMCKKFKSKIERTTAGVDGSSVEADAKGRMILGNEVGDWSNAGWPTGHRVPLSAASGGQNNPTRMTSTTDSRIERQEQQRNPYAFGYESSETLDEIPPKKRILDYRYSQKNKYEATADALKPAQKCDERRIEHHSGLSHNPSIQWGKYREEGHKMYRLAAYDSSMANTHPQNAHASVSRESDANIRKECPTRASTVLESTPSRAQTPEHLNGMQNISKDMNMRLKLSGYNSQTKNNKQYSMGIVPWDSQASPITPRNHDVKYRYDQNPSLVPSRYVSGATVVSDVATPSPKGDDFGNRRDGHFLIPSIRKVPKSITASLNNKFRTATRISSQNSLGGTADRFDDFSDDRRS